MSTTFSTRRAASAPHKPPSTQAGWHRASVHEVSAQAVSLRVGDRVVQARQAFSCLVALQTGDGVAALVDDQQQWWVMAVLERSGAQDMQLQSQGSLELNAERVGVNARDTLSLAAPQVRLSCEQADAMGERLNLVGSAVKAIGATLSTLFDRVQHHSQQHMRSTEGLDRTQAGHMELQARQLLQIHSEHALIDGEKLVKARGAQIHLG
ncbi:DUF3540 domain-containing protein [Variovorax sp. Root411]|uniref:DUF3540 domain-containing protein n=1 Tax=Variovorax sp. Root411 TaxID=1736530 RepID=UPI0006F7B958|nr:DUF3540 domain-containing protein [Variovorax sp. Root411]KQW59238.1 hypothetical protein ASC92_06310 [Variovorax sp. Root411]